MILAASRARASRAATNPLSDLAGWSATQRGDAGRKAKEITMDFSVSNHGSIFLLQPLTVAARAWIEEHVDPDHQEWADGVVVEHRFILDLVAGIQRDGLRARWSDGIQRPRLKLVATTAVTR